MKKGELTVGFGARDDKIGPEFQFGHVMGDHFGEPVLLIKTAWGGKSLALNFRPPIAGKPGFEIKARRDGTTPKPGEYYRLMMTQAKEVLGNLKKHFPQYADRGYEIAGFCWHQGWNDGCNEDWAKEYAKNMPIFIRDLRKDLGVANLPFVIANSGFGGRKSHGGVVGRLQKMVQPAQTAAAKNAENVTCVDTRNFHRPEDKSPGRGDIEHWFSNAESYFLIGDAMGKAMKQMLGEPKMAPKKLAKPSKEDAEKFSYYLGHRNGKALAASPKQRPADNDAFLRGVRGSLGVEKTRASDKDNVDCKKGVKLGSQIALFAERRFPYLQLPKIVEGLGAGLTGKEPAYSTEVLKAAMIACSKFIKTPPTKKYIMLNKQAPKWDVGPWHQLPEGKTSLDISDFKGKVLYMYCFQSWCPGCHSRGFPALKQVSAKYKDDDSVKFVVFQTVFEDRASKPVNTFGNLKKIAQKYGLTMPFAQSGSREDKSKVMKAYKTRGTP
ncbi:MAG: sialate O-acetylesterase, partial [Phycisphaerae bacterium]|nr:sialate O-acetylesterase [Phycisphaerae bacterium]